MVRMNSTAASIAVIIVLIGGTIFFTKSNAQPAVVPSADNVSVVDGRQIIELNAKGGYLPMQSTAKAGIPTTLRLNTNGTFDCSSSIRIPSMNISKNLPPTGTTDIDIGTQGVSKFQGTCGMGMYPFEIHFT